MSTNTPPHLRLSLPLPAQSFKRSFQQFGLDIDTDSPGGSADDGLGTSASAGTSRSALGSQSGSGGSNENRNGVDMGREYGGERNKRARSEGPGGGGVDGDVSGSGGGVDTSSGSISSFVVGSSGSSANVSRSSQTTAGSSSSYISPVPWETSASSDIASMLTTTVTSPSIDPAPIGPIFGSGVPGLGLNQDAPTSARSNARSDTYVGFRSPADLGFLHSLERYTEFERNIAPLRPTPSPEGISSQPSATSAWSSRAAAATSGATGAHVTTASTHDAPTRVGRERTRRRRSGGLLAFLRPSRPTSPIGDMEEVAMVPPSRSDVSNLRVDLGAYLDRATRETDAQRTFAEGPPTANTSRHSLASGESSLPSSHTSGWRFHSPEPRSASSSRSSEQPLSFPWDEDSYSDMLRRLEGDNLSETEQDALDTDSEPSFMLSPSNVSRRLGGPATLRRDTRDFQSSSHGAAGDGRLDLPSMQDLYGDILGTMHIPAIPSQLNGSGRSAWRLASDPQATGMRESGSSSNESRILRDNRTRYGLGRSATVFASPSRLRAPGRVSSSFDQAPPRGEQARNDFASSSSPSTPSSNRPSLPTLRSAVEMEAMRSAATGQSTRLGSLDRLDDGFLVDREDDDDRLSRLGERVDSSNR